MEERLTALEKTVKDLALENSSLKQDITSLKNKVSSLEKKNNKKMNVKIN